MLTDSLTHAIQTVWETSRLILHCISHQNNSSARS